MVWEAAKSLWQSAHYRQAVGQAAIKINAEAQTSWELDSGAKWIS